MSLGLGLQTLLLWKLLGMKQSSESWSCSWVLQMYCGCTEMGEDLSLALSALIPGMVMAQLDHCEDEEYPGCLPLGPSLSFRFCLEALIAPVWRSGHRMSDKGRVLRFILLWKLVFFLQAVAFTLPCGFPSLGIFALKERKQGLCSAWHAAVGVAPGSAVVQGAPGEWGVVVQSTCTLCFSRQSQEAKQSVGRWICRWGSGNKDFLAQPVVPDIFRKKNKQNTKIMVKISNSI